MMIKIGKVWDPAQIEADIKIQNLRYAVEFGFLDLKYAIKKLLEIIQQIGRG